VGSEDSNFARGTFSRLTVSKASGGFHVALAHRDRHVFPNARASHNNSAAAPGLPFSAAAPKRFISPDQDASLARQALSGLPASTPTCCWQDLVPRGRRTASSLRTPRRLAPIVRPGPARKLVSICDQSTRCNRAPASAPGRSGPDTARLFYWTDAKFLSMDRLGYSKPRRWSRNYPMQTPPPGNSSTSDRPLYIDSKYSKYLVSL
jgi:hypothetical protein